MVGSPGVEPDSPGFQAGVMTAPTHFPLVGRVGFEPTTRTSSGCRSTIGATFPDYDLPLLAAKSFAGLVSLTVHF